MIRTSKLSLMLAIALSSGAAHAGGPLFLSDETGSLKPLKWDTSRGPIPVYTDGGARGTELGRRQAGLRAQLEQAEAELLALYEADAA